MIFVHPPTWLNGSIYLWGEFHGDLFSDVTRMVVYKGNLLQNVSFSGILGGWFPQIFE